jgi:DNA polymerase-3 subunit delta'
VRKPPPDGQPCNGCSACHWFGQGNHPDFTVVRPEALEAGAGEAEGDGESSSKKKAPSKIIRMEQVRALIEAVCWHAPRGFARGGGLSARRAAD